MKRFIITNIFFCGTLCMNMYAAKIDPMQFHAPRSSFEQIQYLLYSVLDCIQHKQINADSVDAIVFTIQQAKDKYHNEVIQQDEVYHAVHHIIDNIQSALRFYEHDTLYTIIEPTLHTFFTA